MAPFRSSLALVLAVVVAATGVGCAGSLAGQTMSASTGSQRIEISAGEGAAEGSLPAASIRGLQTPPPPAGTRGIGLGGRTWQPIGPANRGGRTRALVINPADSKTMFAGAITGGVWKTTDGGGSWHPVSEGIPNLAVGALTMDPRNPDVIYAGTGESYYATVGAIAGDGMYRTTDGGAIWTHLDSTSTPDWRYVGAIVVSSADSNRIYAATGTGIWRTTDGGDSWKQVLPDETALGCMYVVARKDLTPETLLASCGGVRDPGRIVRSTDGGDSWTAVVDNIGGQGIGVSTLAFAPGDQRTVYGAVASMMTDAGDEVGLGLIRSDDGGAPGSWRVQNDGRDRYSPFFGHCESGTAEHSQGGYSNDLAVDPTDRERVWVGGIDLYRSDDGGRTLTIASYWWLGYETPDTDGTPYTHADQHAIVFDPKYDGRSVRTVYFANDGGVFRTDDDRAPLAHRQCPTQKEWSAKSPLLNSVVFRAVNNGYSVAQFSGAAVSDDGGMAVGGTQDNGSILSDGAASATEATAWRQVFGGDGGVAAVDSASRALYVQTPASSHLSLFRLDPPDYTDGIYATENVNDHGEFYGTIAMDPGDPRVLYTGGTMLWRTEDSGQHWTQITEPEKRVIAAIGLAPSDPRVAYLLRQDGKITTTSDVSGAPPSWSSPAALPPQSRLSSSAIAVDPRDPKTAYVATGSREGASVFKTTDLGARWVNITGSLPAVAATAVAVNPKNPSMVFVGTDAGVFQSIDGGRTWGSAGDGIPATAVGQLLFRKGTSELYAFTYGRGAYRVDVGA